MPGHGAKPPPGPWHGRAAAPDDIRLLIVPDADLVDLYDREGSIPFDALDGFFTRNGTRSKETQTCVA
ncbi:hypothetical protein JHN59_07505 [Streptomyces sp. MBT49]|uniref:hypothetical protein n=1 Tax=Streptomyces sp. MBT49 TaxID=1488380 RepID=UPI00190B35BD|nr:hypothetical protein [Streptomyces sp. MBT49]MBK3624695.1 hypothetical protein [Streptomyces sp. MBT49]